MIKLPLKIYIVIATEGEYSNRNEYCVKAFASENEAKALIAELSEKDRLNRIKSKEEYYAHYNTYKNYYEGEEYRLRIEETDLI